jgi:hypothetical protein
MNDGCVCGASVILFLFSMSFTTAYADAFHAAGEYPRHNPPRIFLRQTRVPLLFCSVNKIGCTLQRGICFRIGHRS